MMKTDPHFPSGNLEGLGEGSSKLLVSQNSENEVLKKGIE